MNDINCPERHDMDERLRAVIENTIRERRHIKQTTRDAHRPLETLQGGAVESDYKRHDKPGRSTSVLSPTTHPSPFQKRHRTKKELSLPNLRRQQGVVHRQSAPTAKDIALGKVPTHVCRQCKSLGSDEKCIRTIEVEERKDAKDLIGCVLTCAPENDRLKPRITVSAFYSHLEFKVDLSLLSVGRT